jgi:hypothetical protein
VRTVRNQIRVAALGAVAGLCVLGTATATSATASASSRSGGEVAAGLSAGGEVNVPGFSTLDAIACPTAKACVAVGTKTNTFDGRSVVINAATGGVKAWTGSLANVDPNAIACPGKTTCVATADDAIESVKVSNGAMKVTGKIPLPSDGIVALNAIGCAGSKDCYAVGFEGSEAASNALLVKLSAAGKILSKAKGTPTGYGAIGCPSTTTCLVARHTKTAELIEPLTNGRFGSGHKLPADTYVQSISCYAGKLCYAMSGRVSGDTERTDELIPLNPKTGKPGKVVSLGGLNGDGFTCYSATQCIVVGFTGTGSTAVTASVVVSKGKAGAVKHYKSLPDPFDAVGCATAKLCYAVGPGKGSYAVVVKV